MHYRYIVVFDKEKAKNSEKARKFVKNYLEETNFVSENGQADWFVIGGRFSGELTRVKLDQEKLKQFEDDFNKKYGFWTNKENSEKRRHSQAKVLFKKYFPEYKSEALYFRDAYRDLGYKDDAQIIDEMLYDELIEILVRENDPESYLDIDDKKLSKEQMLNRWCVIVDYHN